MTLTPDERRVELNWPSPLPENDLEKLQQAEAKLRIRACAPVPGPGSGNRIVADAPAVRPSRGKDPAT